MKNFLLNNALSFNEDFTASYNSEILGSLMSHDISVSTNEIISKIDLKFLYSNAFDLTKNKWVKIATVSIKPKRIIYATCDIQDASNTIGIGQLCINTDGDIEVRAAENLSACRWIIGQIMF